MFFLVVKYRARQVLSAPRDTRQALDGLSPTARAKSPFLRGFQGKGDGFIFSTRNTQVVHTSGTQSEPGEARTGKRRGGTRQSGGGLG